VVLGREWRILGAVEAVTGVLMFGWSTGVLFTVVHHLHSRLFSIHTVRQSPGSIEGG
jgi:hypothetical protein